MISKEAISQLQNDATAAALLAVSNGQATIIPQDYQLLDIEKYAATPRRFRGKFETGSINDFIRYANDNKQPDSGLFISDCGRKAKLIVDHGTPEAPKHGNHIALLTLKSTSAYDALLSQNGCKTTQQALAEWIEEWGEHIAIEDADGQTMSIAQATASIRKIEIKSKGERDFEEEEGMRKVSAMEQIEAKMRGQQPKTLRFTCVPFEGFGPIQAEIRLAVIASKDAPILSTRIIRLEALKESVNQQFKQILSEGIRDIPTYVGNFIS